MTSEVRTIHSVIRTSLGLVIATEQIVIRLFARKIRIGSPEFDHVHESICFYINVWEKMPTRFNFTKTSTKPCTHLGKPVGHCSVTKY